MTQKITTNFVRILFVLLLSSCVAKVGNPKTVNLYKAKIDEGSSLASVTGVYGDYSDFWKDEYGNNIYQYSYSQNKYDLVSYLPIINHFGFIKSENYEVVLTMSNKNLLIHKSSFHDLALSRNSLVCNPEIYSCLRKVINKNK